MYISSVLHSQYHARWCTCDFRSQCISRHGIDPHIRNILSPASEELISTKPSHCQNQCVLALSKAWVTHITQICRHHAEYGLSQWEVLLRNTFSHWPSPYPEWSLIWKHIYSCIAGFYVQFFFLYISPEPQPVQVLPIQLCPIIIQGKILKTNHTAGSWRWYVGGP